MTDSYEIYRCCLYRRGDRSREAPVYECASVSECIKEHFALIDRGVATDIVAYAMQERGPEAITIDCSVVHA